jgi:hypothetical protein
MSHSPRVLLLVTTDQRLMNHPKAVVDSLGFDLRVAESPLIARDLWEGAEYVLVGSDLAGKCIENLVPRRPHLLVLHTKSEPGQGVAPESISERDVWRHVSWPVAQPRVQFEKSFIEMSPKRTCKSLGIFIQSWLNPRSRANLA